MTPATLPESTDALSPRSVLVVEDEPLLRELIVTALETRGLEVVAAGSPSDAVRAFRAVDPDGVVMDIDLGPGPNGFDLAEQFVRRATGVAIVFLTNLPDPRFAGREADELPAGIAYLRKGAVHEIDVLIDTLDATMRGDIGDGMRHDRDPERPLASLTRRQVEVLRLVALGRTNAQIAAQRGTTVKSAERAVARAFAALGVDATLDGNLRVEAARRFIGATGNPLPVGES
ncbi:MAG: response regulator [Gaiellales bacterium]